MKKIIKFKLKKNIYHILEIDLVMCIFRYNQDQKTNLLNFSRDLYIFLNTKLDSDEQIIKYTNDFVNYFNQIIGMVKNFKNDIENLIYEYEFEVSFGVCYSNPSICLKKLQQIFPTDLEINRGKINKHVKHFDYLKIISLLDYNYSVWINTYPYFIYCICKTDEYIQYDDFYEGKFILLNNKDLTKHIELNFDNGLVYFYRFNKDICEYEFDNYEQASFKIYKNRLVVIDGPIIELGKTDNDNEILLDEELYLIEPESSVNILGFI